ncbi:terminase small subunit [Terrihabitans rhizophilus]|uniref:Terminase small subunit n=1 Tax=Terrihabitans rhizophilus TaxID=3092662 RepID=A0ABU4RU15_9HYPH|nr:terminase small subunit [Terrihabitans sp. PJ23]MDX6806326.1 terminase small subunit [Terrihabitans sp. PJ23]
MSVVGTGRNVTQADLAALFGITVVTVRAWERKGLPIVAKGGKGKASTYNTAAVARWREEQVALAATGDTNAMDIEEARRRKTAAEAALAEMDLAIRRGEYVLVEAVGAVVEAEYATIRANFSSMPGDIAGDLEHLQASEIEELLATKVSEILNELSADSEYASEDTAQEGESGGLEAAAEA